MSTTELRFEVVIDPKLPATSPDFVMFETGAGRTDRDKWAYDHHGSDFSPGHPGALTIFFEDLAMGAPWPLKLGLHAVKGVDTVVAVALFTGRDLAILPSTAGLITSVDLYHRYGVAGLAHVSSDVAKFLVLLNGYFPPGLSKEQAVERLTHAVAWVREYLLEDKLPHLGAALPTFRVVDIGSNGFIVAECDQPSIATWGQVYRDGFLRGVLFGPDRDTRRVVVAARKSLFVELDLMRASRLLSELERALGGEDSDWGADDFFLRSPEEGTSLLPSTILEILLRC